MSDDRFDRKQLFTRGWQRLTGFFAEGLESRLDFVPRRFVRPPGAQIESLFVTTCTGCADCLTACPKDSIRLTGDAGFRADSTPVIHPVLTPCYLCPDTPCAVACPSGALIPPGPGRIKIGTAVVQRSSCLGFAGEECAKCVESCPVGAAAIGRGPEGGPVVVPDSCTGCGICTFVCPTTPRSIRIRPV